jgi:hypothetical protein
MEPIFESFQNRQRSAPRQYQSYLADSATSEFKAQNKTHKVPDDRRQNPKSTYLLVDTHTLEKTVDTGKASLRELEAAHYKVFTIVESLRPSQRGSKLGSYESHMLSQALEESSKAAESAFQSLALARYVSSLVLIEVDVKKRAIFSTKFAFSAGRSKKFGVPWSPDPNPS